MRELEHNVVSILYSLKGMIESHLELAREGADGQKEFVSQHAEDVLRRAYSQADKALQITKKLGKVLEPPEDFARKDLKVCLCRAWEEVLEILRQEQNMERIEMLCRIPPNFPLIQCDPRDFREILYNLGQNAVQAMKGSGKLVIRAQRAFSVKEEPFAVVTLADTGQGISEENLPYLFEPFFTGKNLGQGSGLGLYLAKALAARNGGRISVSSFEGCGATFTLEFPVSSHLK